MEQKRQVAIQELVNTEETYMRDLHAVTEVIELYLNVWLLVSSSVCEGFSAADDGVWSGETRGLRHYFCELERSHCM